MEGAEHLSKPYVHLRRAGYWDFTYFIAYLSFTTNILLVILAHGDFAHHNLAHICITHYHSHL